MAKKSKSNQTWDCSGMPNSPHDPFSNFGPDCSVCGAKRSDIIGSGKGGGKPGGPTSGGKKLPIGPIAAGCGIGLLVLGGGWLMSPHIGVICEMTDNCSAWDQDLSKAQKLASESKAVADKKDSPKAELESARSNISRAITLLNPLKQKSSVKAKVTKALAEAQSTQAQLDEKIAKLGTGAEVKPTPTPTPAPTLKPEGESSSGTGDGKSGGLGDVGKVTDRVQPVRDPVPVYTSPEPVAEAEAPRPPVREPETRPEPVAEAPPPRYEPPAERPSSSAPPRDEQIIPN